MRRWHASFFPGCSFIHDSLNVGGLVSPRCPEFLLSEGFSPEKPMPCRLLFLVCPCFGPLLFSTFITGAHLSWPFFPRA